MAVLLSSGAGHGIGGGPLCRCPGAQIRDGDGGGRMSIRII